MTTVDEELESLKASIHLLMDDESFIALLDELDRTPDRLGLLKSTLARLSEANAVNIGDLLARHGLTVEQEVGVRNYFDDQKQQAIRQEYLRGWALIKTNKGVSVRSGRTGAWVPYNHQVAAPYTTKADAERAALQYADHLEREIANHRVPVKQVVLRVPMALEFPDGKGRLSVNIDLDKDARTALNSLMAGLQAGNVEMANGHRVDTPTHAIRWLMEQLEQKM